MKVETHIKIVYFILEKNSRENATHRVPRDIFKVVIKGKFITPNTFINKHERKKEQNSQLK